MHAVNFYVEDEKVWEDLKTKKGKLGWRDYFLGLAGVEVKKQEADPSVPA